MLTLFVGVLACFKGRAEQKEFKREAESSLKEIAELLVRQRGDEVVPYPRSKGEVKKTSPMRTRFFQNEDFTITVPFDSAKDSRSLYNLGTPVGAEAMILMSKNQFPLDSIYAKWQSFLDKRNVVCALQLNVDPVLKQDTLLIAGNPLLCIPQNKYKTYYVDSFYAIQLTTYLQSPSYWVDAPLSLKILFYILLTITVAGFVMCLFKYLRSKFGNAVSVNVVLAGMSFLLLLVFTGLMSWSIYSDYQEQVAQQKEVIQETFREVLTDEVMRKSKILSLIPSFYHSEGPTLIQPIPDTVRVVSAMGMRAYPIVPYRFEHSLYKETEMRADISYILYKCPLSVDTLYHRLDSVLREKAISVPTSVRYTNIDLEERSSAYFAPSEKRCLPQDSLTTWYLGFRCEGEVTVYCHPRVAMSLLWANAKTYCLLAGWVLFVLFFLFRHRLAAALRTWAVKSEAGKQEPVIEKEIPCIDVNLGDAELFKLSDTAYFNASTGVLCNGELEVTLKGRTLCLLTAFLHAPDFLLTEEEIYDTLWDGGGSKGSKNTEIYRLREVFKKLDLPIIVQFRSGTYQLKNPHSSTEKAGLK